MQIIYMQYLPYSGFKWLNEKESDRFDVNSIEENSPIGYILEVDLKYLRQLYNDHPLAPESLKLVKICCQIICFNIADKYGIKIGGVDKLVPNLRNKGKYVVHYKNL